MGCKRMTSFSPYSNSRICSFQRIEESEHAVAFSVTSLVVVLQQRKSPVLLFVGAVIATDPVTESVRHGEVVPMPTFPPLAIVKYVEVANVVSEEVPIEKLPEAEVMFQCLALAPAPISVSVSCGRKVTEALEEAICVSHCGVVVPMPTRPVLPMIIR